MEWLIAGIIATIAGTIGAIDYNIDYKNKVSELNEQKKEIEAQYNDRKDLAEKEWNKAVEEAERNVEAANNRADVQDKGLDIQERMLSNEFNSQVSDIQLQQESDLFSWNNALMSMGVNEGNELSQLSTSGVRAGSSMGQAVDLEAALNTSALQFQMDATRQSQNYAMANLGSKLEWDNFNIFTGRNDADILRDDAAYLHNSYMQGGSNYEIYNQQLDNLFNDKERNKNGIQRELNRMKDNRFWGTVSALFNYGNKGFESGWKWTNEWTNYNPNYTTGISK